MTEQRGYGAEEILLNILQDARKGVLIHQQFLEKAKRESLISASVWEGRPATHPGLGAQVWFFLSQPCPLHHDSNAKVNLQDVCNACEVYVMS